MSAIHDIINNIPLPNMIPVKQTFENKHLEDVPAEVRKQLDQYKIRSTVKPGMTIAVTGGSRGIRHIDEITKVIVDFLIEMGTRPFLVAAMGSHGGADIEGQQSILNGYNLTEDYLGCPVNIGTEYTHIGETEDGRPVYIDQYAAKADAIVLINRIKPHTAFRGPYESGLVKMMAIGLAKQKGAETCHAAGFEKMAKMLPLFGEAVLKNANVIFGLAILENAYDQTSELVALTNQEILKEEPRLLEKAKANMPKILVDNIDVLIVAQIGKNFSGDGMDPNISGTFATKCASGGINTQRVAVLDISDESHGNGVGWGMADVSTKRAYAKFSPEMSYPNALTCLVTQVVKVPMIFDNDKECIQAAIKLCADIDFEKAKVVYVRNTLHLSEIFISESLKKQAEQTEGIKMVGESNPLEFDSQGNLRFL